MAPDRGRGLHFRNKLWPSVGGCGQNFFVGCLALVKFQFGAPTGFTIIPIWLAPPSARKAAQRRKPDTDLDR
jgi:hypothetical protein